MPTSYPAFHLLGKMRGVGLKHIILELVAPRAAQRIREVDVNDEMVEKARAHYDSLPEETKYKWAGEVKPHWAFAFAASFARSAVRDALAEMDKFTTHGYDCSMHHAWNPANKHCDCGLSALRKKFEVEG